MESAHFNFMNVSSLFSSYDKNEINIREFNKTVIEFQLMQVQSNSSRATEICKFINSSLTSCRQRVCGLVCLHALLDQCDGALLVKQTQTWVRLLLSVLQSRDPAPSHGLACLVTSSLIKHLSHFAELSRDFTSGSNGLQQLLSSLLDAETQWLQPAMQCLLSCLKTFPGASITAKAKTEAFALRNMESENPKISKLAMQLYGCLPCLGGGGSGGAKHVEAWVFYMNKLHSSLHQTLDTLFSQCPRGEVYERGEERVQEWSDEDRSGLDLYMCLARRFNTLSHGVSAMLSGGVETAVPVPVRQVLRLVQRLCSYTPAFVLRKLTTSRADLVLVFPVLYQSAITLLTSLLRCLSSALVPYASAINRCLIQILAASHVATSPDMIGATAKTFCGVRTSVYNFLKQSCTILGANCGLEGSTAEKVVKEIQLDISPQVDALKLVSGKSSSLAAIASQMTNRGKKKAKGGASGDGSELASQHKQPSLVNASLCLAALEALETILQTYGLLIEPKQHHCLHNMLLPLALSLQPTPAVYPYTDALCRRALYRLLVTCVRYSHTRLCPPTTPVVSLLAHAHTSDPSLKVREACQQSLALLESLCHPRLLTSVNQASLDSMFSNCLSETELHNQTLEKSANGSASISAQISNSVTDKGQSNNERTSSDKEHNQSSTATSAVEEHNSIGDEEEDIEEEVDEDQAADEDSEAASEGSADDSEESSQESEDHRKTEVDNQGENQEESEEISEDEITVQKKKSSTSKRGPVVDQIETVEPAQKKQKTRKESAGDASDEEVDALVDELLADFVDVQPDDSD